MGVKHLQKLDIRSDDGNQIPLVPALQFGGAQAAQGGEHPIADECQQLEGDDELQACSP